MARRCSISFLAWLLLMPRIDYVFSWHRPRTGSSVAVVCPAWWLVLWKWVNNAKYGKKHTQEKRWYEACNLGCGKESSAPPSLPCRAWLSGLPHVWLPNVTFWWPGEVLGHSCTQSWVTSSACHLAGDLPGQREKEQEGCLLEITWPSAILPPDPWQRRRLPPWSQGSGQGEGHAVGMLFIDVSRPGGYFHGKRKVSKSSLLFRASADRTVTLRAGKAGVLPD